MTKLNPDLLQAYREAVYEIHVETTIQLKVSEYSHPLEELHKNNNCTTSALLTACNPRSQILSEQENSQRMAALTEAVEKLGYAHLPAVGHDPTGEWPDEPSLWIPEMTKNEAEKLAQAFKQNGFLWIAADARPELHLLR